MNLHRPVLRLALPMATALSLALAGCSPATPTAPGGGTPPATTPGGAAPAKGSDSVLGKGKVGGPRSSAAKAVRGTAGALGKPGRMLLAIYLMGSDLEDNKASNFDAANLNKDGAGTSDLNEILEAYQSLTDAEKANIDVFVAFGGARQVGWKGVKYIDLAGLVKDGQDGYFGNDAADTYSFQDEAADMGDPVTFQAFLKQVQARSADSAKTFLDVWDHGAAYGGIGPDTNTEHVLSNAAQRASFEATNFKADIIGYDACLMASVEVVAAVKDHFSYLIASEELEPGHGWDYSQLVSHFAKNPNATLPELGTFAVDSFLDSPRHASTNGRTLSLINLAQGDALLSALDGFAGAYAGNVAESYQGLLDAAGKATPFGSEGQRGDEVAIDLHGFATGVKVQAPAGAASADALLGALGAAVVYSREDGSKPGSHGLSVFSLQNLGTFKDASYTRVNAASSAWFSFVEAFMNRSTNDQTAPSLEAEQVATEAGEAGTQIGVSDDVGIEDVNAVHLVRPDAATEVFYVVGQVPMLEREENTYFQPEWDGKALHLVTPEGGRLVVPTTEEAEAEDGHVIHTVDGTLNGDDVLFSFMLDADHAVVDYWASPLTESENGEMKVDKEQYVIEAGDVVAFWQEVIDAAKDEERFDLTTPVTIAGEPEFTWEVVAGTGYYFTLVEDMAGNIKTSDVHEVGQDAPVVSGDGGEEPEADEAA